MSAAPNAKWLNSSEEDMEEEPDSEDRDFIAAEIENAANERSFGSQSDYDDMPTSENTISESPKNLKIDKNFYEKWSKRLYGKKMNNAVPVDKIPLTLRKANSKFGKLKIKISKIGRNRRQFEKALKKSSVRQMAHLLNNGAMEPWKLFLAGFKSWSTNKRKMDEKENAAVLWDFEHLKRLSNLSENGDKKSIKILNKIDGIYEKHFERKLFEKITSKSIANDFYKLLKGFDTKNPKSRETVLAVHLWSHQITNEWRSAITEGNCVRLFEILALGLNPKSEDYELDVQLAAENDRKNVLELLIDCGVKVDITECLAKSLFSDKTETAGFLLEKGADPDIKVESSKTYTEEKVPIVVEMLNRRQIECASLLVRKGADTNFDVLVTNAKGRKKKVGLLQYAQRFHLRKRFRKNEKMWNRLKLKRKANFEKTILTELPFKNLPEKALKRLLDYSF
ncbi:hypothetical protein MHBO_000343 [Bonamia ostreae]|uniref:Ankyrin repeat protein n=1 Tax=Bonamia ostreae TaxID=126728 RepID=A0ABV2AFC3_9EUKA